MFIKFRNTYINLSNVAYIKVIKEKEKFYVVFYFVGDSENYVSFKFEDENSLQGFIDGYLSFLLN